MPQGISKKEEQTKSKNSGKKGVIKIRAEIKKIRIEKQ